MRNWRKGLFRLSVVYLAFWLCIGLYAYWQMSIDVILLNEARQQGDSSHQWTLLGTLQNDNQLFNAALVMGIVAPIMLVIAGLAGRWIYLGFRSPDRQPDPEHN